MNKSLKIIYKINKKRELMQISFYELSGTQNSSIGAEAADIY